MNKLQMSMLCSILKQYSELIQYAIELGKNATSIQKEQLTTILKDLNLSANVLSTQIKQCAISPEKCNAVILYHCACLGRVKKQMKKVGEKFGYYQNSD